LRRIDHGKSVNIFEDLWRQLAEPIPRKIHWFRLGSIVIRIDALAVMFRLLLLLLLLLMILISQKLMHARVCVCVFPDDALISVSASSETQTIVITTSSRISLFDGNTGRNSRGGCRAASIMIWTDSTSVLRSTELVGRD
jgi:hypothetical protein